MICHSFELERLDVRNPAKKYIPRSSRVQIDGNALDSLSSVVQSKADESYRNFITDLLRRGVVNIVDLLRNDPELERMLDEEARSLNNWWVDRHGFGSN